ncbi:MAG TPA: membrane protein insertase YidC [Candidatus Angelobacter sp.]|nr:membrane protein insertase YidC [Candidatus Angelobacter sp.]
MTEYHNPQDDPGAQRRMMLAFLLVFVAIFVMQLFLPKPQQPAKPQQQAQQQTPQPSPTGFATPSPSSVSKPVSSSSAAPKAQTKQASAETEKVLENDYYRITFTNRGAQVKSWILKKYKDDKNRPLDLVNATAAAAHGNPLSLFSFDKDLQRKLNEALYVATQAPSGEISFEYSDGDVAARKTFRPDRMYVVDMDTLVTRGGQGVAVLPQWPAALGDQVTVGSYSQARIDWNQSGSVERKPPFSGNFITGRKWVVDGQAYNGPFNWAALVDQYFTAAFMPQQPDGTQLVTFHNQIEVPKNAAKPEEAKDKASVLGFALGHSSGSSRLRIFAGPKAVDVLESTQAQPGGPDLRGVLDFGFFGFIAKPLFLWLKWTHEHMIPDWGWSIAFLTLVITMALLPLRISSQKSMLKMQKIQPQIKAITEKYKRYSMTDPRRQDMQREMSELYKKEGVNPVGGCFPMLLQMPFLFAFYSMLGNAIELRQASWLWIHDLSSPDPLKILPIAIGLSLFVMQRSTPQAGMDPAQQKMMNVLGPVMLGGFSWGMPAGLCVYWAISNLLGWFQQFFLNRTELAQQVRKSQERRASRKK